MVYINLLPWREERCEERKRLFFIMIGFVSFAAMSSILLLAIFYKYKIETQLFRNDFLNKEIIILDGRIKEVNELKEQRQHLIERMRIIQDLQEERSVVGRVYDQFVRTLPDGIFFKSIVITGSDIFITGVAESNNDISNLLRNLERSIFFSEPNLSAVKAITLNNEIQLNEFSLTVQKVRNKKEGK